MRIIFSCAIAAALFLSVSCRSESTVKPPVQDTVSKNTDMVHPWAGYGVGSFVVYKKLMPDGAYQTEKQVAVEVGPEDVILEAFVLNNDKWETKGKVHVPIHTLERPAKGFMNFEDATLTIAGRIVKCKTVEIPMPGVHKRIWMSNEVPGGMVRHVVDGAVVLEALDFSRK